jgi:hypothetical protein
MICFGNESEGKTKKKKMSNEQIVLYMIYLEVYQNAYMNIILQKRNRER